MKGLVLRTFLYFGLLITLTSMSRGQQISLTDIALGSSFDDAIAKLRSKGLKILPVNMRVDTVMADLPVQTAAFGIGSAEVYSLHAIGGKVIYVFHYIRFSQGSEPDVNTTLLDLRHKYGNAPTFYSDRVNDSPRNIRFNWQFNAQHQVVSRGDSFFTCQTSGGGPELNVPVGTDGAQGSRNLVALSATLPKNSCTAGVEAKVGTSPQNPNLVQILDIGIIDQAAVDSYDRQLYAKAKARSDDEHEKATQRKAPM